MNQSFASKNIRELAVAMIAARCVGVLNGNRFNRAFASLPFIVAKLRKWPPGHDLLSVTCEKSNIAGQRLGRAASCCGRNFALTSRRLAKFGGGRLLRGGGERV